MSGDRPGFRWERVSEEETAADGVRTRTVVEHEVPCHCDGGWVEDEGWYPEYREQALKSYRKTPGDGIIPCGSCNFGGWDTPWPGDD